MKVIIPMAGLGSRMRPHTHSIPKPLVNVGGQPMLKYLMDAVQPLGVDEYIFIIGYLGDKVEAWVTDNYDVNAHFVVQEELIGQAHAIHLAKEYLTGPAIVLFSDTLFETDMTIVQRTDADAIAFVKEVDDPRRFGVVSLDDDGKVEKFVEKPDSMENKNAVIGLYWLRESADMIKAIETQMDRNQMTKGEFYLADAFQIMIEEGSVFRTQNVDSWLDCGKPETVLETNRWLLDTQTDNSSEINLDGVTIIPPVNIAPDAIITRSVIGPHVVVASGAEVHQSVVENSIIAEGATVHNAILTESLIGPDASATGQVKRVNIGETSSTDL